MERRKIHGKKVVLTVLIILALLIIIAAAFIFYKLTSLNSSINDPLDRKHSELRDGPIKRRANFNSAFGIDSDEVRNSEHGGQRSDSIVLLSINPKDKNRND